MHRFLHRRAIGWIVATALLLAAGWIVWPRRAEPVYLGRPVRSYFASWQRPGSGGWPPKQLDGLGDNLTPEAVPVLIEALNRTDSPAQLQAMRLRANVPRWLRERLPEPVPAMSIRTTAATTLLQGMKHSTGARPVNRAVASEFSKVPADLRREVLRRFGYDPSAAEAAEPLLLEALRGTNAVERVMAADALFELGAGPSHRLEALIAALTPMAGKAREFPNAWPGFCRDLGRLGPAGRPALPLLRQLAENALPEIRAEAALACWRVEPGNESAGGFLARELGRLGSRGAFVLVAAWAGEASALKIPADDALPVLARLLEHGTKAGRSPAVRPATEAVIFILEDHYTQRRVGYPAGLPDVLIRQLACELAAGYGAAAASLKPQLRVAANHPDPDVRDAARRALLKTSSAGDPVRDH